MNAPARPSPSWIRSAAVSAAAILVIGFCFFVGPALIRPSLRHDATATFPDGSVWHLQLSATEGERERGLGGLSKLAPDEGMLFLFPTPGRPAFWMKDMKFPIDIVWLSKGQVVDRYENAPVPPDPRHPDKSYLPEADGDAVLELPAGAFEAHHLTVGSRLDIKLPAGYTAPTN